MHDDASLTNLQKTEEFLELYASCEYRLYTYIVMLIGNPTDARDILQDTALVLWQKFDEYDRARPFFTWAHEFARYRTLRYRQMHVSDAPTLEPAALNAVAARFADADQSQGQAFAELLPDCIKTLSDDDRELIQLRYFSGVAVKIIAERLGRSANAVSQSLIRVRRLLRKCVEESARRSQGRDGAIG